MRRALVLPVSAAVVGALLALGISALDRPHSSVHVIRAVEIGDIDMEVEAEIAEAMEQVERIEVRQEVRVDEEFLRQVRQKVRRELRAAMEAEELTEAERRQIREAMEQLEEQLPGMMGVAGLVEGLTREDGSAHKDGAAPEAPAGG
ncbi:MAG: hypothetical protein P8188_09940 [Gemmatimonadota bacterium]|jgi:hypothetical protein